MDLIALADFNLVATHGGFGRASRASGRPKATLSRRVAELEESLGLRLLERGGRSLRLTEEGRALHLRTEGPLSEITEAGEALRATVTTPRGRLRISAPVVFAQLVMGRLAARFVEAHPQVELEITAEDRLVDPLEEDYDLVIRVNPSPDERLVGRCFLRDERLVVAPPTMPRPEAPPDRGQEVRVRAVLLNTTPPGIRWRLSPPEALRLRPEPVMRLSSLPMVRDAVLAGAGAAVLPRMLVAHELRTGQLSCWGTLENGQTALWALHGSRRLVGARLKAFLHCLDEAFPDQTYTPA